MTKIFAYFSKSCVIAFSQMRLLSQTVLSFDHFIYIHLVKSISFDLISNFDKQEITTLRKIRDKMTPFINYCPVSERRL